MASFHPSSCINIVHSAKGPVFLVKDVQLIHKCIALSLQLVVSAKSDSDATIIVKLLSGILFYMLECICVTCMDIHIAIGFQ